MVEQTLVSWMVAQSRNSDGHKSHLYDYDAFWMKKENPTAKYLAAQEDDGKLTPRVSEETTL